ncbi:MAG: MotA/TolQ/ExbB proton channel family protein [Pseudomonadota bacterium]
MNAYNAVVSFFQDGGMFMYPIVIVFAIGLAIALERWVVLSMSAVRNQQVWKKVTPLLKSGDYNQAVIVTRQSKTSVGKILSYGFDRLRSSRRRDDIERAMEESLMEEVPRLEQRTHYLATFANVATLLGLLGTIIGLIKAFTAVAAANPAEKADLLSASISVAMNTTAFGLMVAIPLLLIHTVLQSKTSRIVDSLEMAAVKFLNNVSERTAQKEAA